MSNLLRLQEFHPYFTSEDGEKDLDVISGAVDEIIASVSSLSRKKDLRQDSSELLLLAPSDLVSSKLAGLASGKLSLQATDVGLLLHWSNVLLEKGKLSPETAESLLRTQGLLLAKTISTLFTSHKSANATSRMNGTLVHHSWRSVESFCTHMKDNSAFQFETFIDSVCKQPASITTLALFATAYNKTQTPNLASLLPNKSSEIVESWIQQVLNAKPQEFAENVKPLLESGVLDSIWTGDLISQQVFDEKVVPAIHKGLLRSPEGVITYIIPSLLHNNNLVMDKLVASASLVSNLGSSNVELRRATADAFARILEHTEKPDLSGLLSQFKRTTNSEQRALFAQVLANTPTTGDVEASVVALAAQAPKESSDSSLRVIADAIVKFSSKNNASATEAVKKGLQDQRKPLVREWVNALAVANAGEPFTADLEKIYSSITSNIAAATTAKYASAGYGLLLLLKPAEIDFGLFNSRVYEHLSCDREFELCAKASAEFYAKGDDVNKEGALEAFVNSAIASSASPQQRLTNLHLLRHTLSQDSVTSATFGSLVKVLEKFITVKEVNVSTIVAHIQAKKWMIEAFVLSHQPLAKPSNGEWIQMCLKSNYDPNQLVNENADDLFERATSAHSVNSVATLAFVAPESIATKVDSYLKSEMKAETMSSLDEAILETPEGQLASANSQTFQSRNSGKSKKSDDEWEAEIRKEIAKKHGKLTAEEQKKLEEQTERRKILRVDAARIEFCCGILSKLASDSARGAENGSLEWFPYGIELCLQSIKKNYPGKQAIIECLSSMNVCLSDRFKGHWKMIASKLLLQGKKVDIVAVRSMLCMLNPNSDKRLLDTSSLVYILPTLRSVLENYNGETEDEVAEETVLLVTSLLAHQAEVLAKIPRDNLVEVLLSLLVKYATDRGAIKDCLRRIAQQVMFNANELHMLLDASISTAQDFVRAAAIEIIDAEVDLSSYGFSPEVWIARFGECGDVAQDIWSESGMSVPDENVLDLLVPFFHTKYSVERPAVAKAYTAAAIVAKKVSEAFDLISSLYVEKKHPPKPIINSYGMEVKQKWVDPVPERLTIVAALHSLIPHLAHQSVIKCAEFIANEGVTDNSPEAARANLELGQYLIDEHGKECVDGILPVFEGKQIVLYGFAAQYLPKGDSRLASTVDKLLEALESADESNITVISSSLGPLATRIEYQEVAERTLDNAFSLQTTEARRGAAFGFAGIASGIGLSVLGDVSIINAISGGVDDKKDAGRREGAQLLVVSLSQMFGRKFEPYAIELMTQVLSGLGDVNPIVRKAANEAARSIMAHTTSFGIKRQIPQALDQLDTTAWRGKKGAVELLGSMAYLSPQQLAMSLATIVPEIVALLNDTHKEVRASAKSSMKMFGDVIQNPEIHKLVPTLLDAISDPTKKTDTALTDLLKTRFMHYIDSPSLALIIFVVQRGLRDRSANVKRKACQIVGNMSILTAGSDLVPYLPTIMPDLQVAMTDPVPQTCAVACKALGVLVEKLGEDYFPNVISDLMDSLKRNDSQAISNRWGTAQGLSEVLHGLGTTKLDELLPEIVANCQSPMGHIRQGFVPMLLLLPASFGASLTPYLSELVPPLLRGLADDIDDVRDNALKAGRRIVRGYATVAVDLLLPELERGLWSPRWRIRLASVELVGDLLMELLGKGAAKSASDRLKAIENAAPTASGDVENITEEESSARAAEEEATANEETEKQTGNYVETSLRNLEVLGTARRDRVLASIFVCRADVVAAVRQVAMDTWLALIQNTPRAVKLILPTLVLMLVKSLGDDEEELQSNAARALAELVRRVSDALRLILPTFLENLSDPDARQGICLGLVELIPATQVQALQEHEQEVMHLVRTCLQDSDNSVREAATRALEELHAALGDVAGDMLPEMVDQVVNENDEGALAAIKEMVVSTGAGSVLAAALPALLKSNLDDFKANAITTLCTTAGRHELHLYIDDVVDCLIRSPYTANLDPILTQVCPEAHMLSLAKKDEFLRAPVFTRMASYYANIEKADMLFVSDWVVFALHGLEQENTEESSVQLLQALTSSSAVSKSELAKLASAAYHTLRSLGATIPAFATSTKGPAFVLPFFLNGLTLGGNVEKEQSAMAIAEVLRRTNPAEKLKPVVTQIAGPLIRIVGERTAPDVKAAIIYTLNELLQTIPAFVKPFLPQLQRTFAKNLADVSSTLVRTRSALALGTLIKLQPRIDPLAKEIITGVRTATDEGVRTAFLTALQEVVAYGGKNLSDAVKLSITEVINDSESILGDNGSTETKQLALFARIGAEMLSLSNDEHQSPKRLIEPLLNSGNGNVALQSVLNANAILMHAPQIADAAATEIESVLENAAVSSDINLSENGVKGLGKLLLGKEFSSTNGQLKPVEESAVKSLIALIPVGSGYSSDARRLSILILNALVEHHHSPAVLTPYLDQLAPEIFACARDKNIPVKIAAEKTFLSLFDFVGRHDSILFDEWFANAKDQLDSRMQRSIPEYVRRVALRAANRDTNDEEDENPVDELSEIWAIGS